MIYPHTVNDFLYILLKEGMDGLEYVRPIGFTISQIFNFCLDVAEGDNLDSIAQDHLKLFRHRRVKWTMLQETDVEFRARCKIYTYRLDKVEPIQLNYLEAYKAHVESIKQECAHSWKHYDSGFTQKFDYCEKCDVKR